MECTALASNRYTKGLAMPQSFFFFSFFVSFLFMVIMNTLNTYGHNLTTGIASVIIFFCCYGPGMHVMLRVILTLNNLVISANNFSPVPP